jgi:hypothetical protein
MNLMKIRQVETRGWPESLSLIHSAPERREFRLRLKVT